MTRSRAVVVALILTVACTVGAVVGADGHPASAASDHALQITAVSPWVEPDGVFQVRFAPSTQVPPDAVFSYTVHQRLRPEGRATLRSVLDDVIDGGALSGVLQAPVSAPVSSLGDPAQGLVLDVPVRTSRSGGTGRVLLPTAGVHPVELQLSDAAGRALWKEVVFLNRLPDDPVTGAGGVPAKVSVTMVLPVDGPPALAPDGQPDPDASTTGNLAAAAALLVAVPTAPLVMAVRPNVLSAVTRSDSAVDRRFVAALTAPGRSATVARWPYVAIDTGGLVAADAPGEVRNQVALGDRVLQATTGTAPTTGSWLLDDTVSSESLPLLDDLGTGRLVLSPERLRVGAGVPAELTRTAAVGVQGSPGMTATAYDARLSFRLTAADVDPALRANHVVSEIMTSWFAAAETAETSFPGPSAVLIVPAGTDPAALQALVPALTSGGPLSADPRDIPTRPTVLKGKEVIAALAPRATPDQSGAADAAAATRTRIDGFRSMAPGAATDIDTWELLNAQTLAKDMQPDERAETHARIEAAVSERVASIEVPRSRRVVLTSRDTTIPLRFRNNLPYDVRLVMRARSPRLAVTGGDTQEILLKPGENRIDLPVVVRAPGPAFLRIELRSPDGSIRLPTATVPVSASTISGVGAALSVISLLFLAGWWLRTARGRRRGGARNRGTHPSTDTRPGPAPDTDTGLPGDDPSHPSHPPDRAAPPPPAVVGPDSRSSDHPTGSVGPGG
jgi:hypothetical protein